MTEETVTPTQDEKTNVTPAATPVTPSVPAGQPVAPVQVQPAPAAPASTAHTDPDIAPDGKRWADKYAGLQGALQQTRQQLHDANQAHAVQLTTLEEQFKAAQGELERASEQLGQVPALLERIKQLEAAQAQAERMRLLMDHPDLLQRQLTEEVVVKDDEGNESTQTRTFNPVLRLVESSTLPAEDLSAELGRLSQMYAVQPAVATDAEPKFPQAPSPAPPAGGETIESLQRQAEELHKRVNEDGGYTPTIGAQLSEIYQKINKLQLEQAATS